MTPRLFRRLRALTLICASLTGLGACAAEVGPKVQFISHLDWPPGPHRMGGFSGLELSEDGTRFTAISDRGFIVTGRLHREGPKLTAIEEDTPGPLRNAQGAPVSGLEADSEGLAIGPDGRVHVSFEGLHRVSAYPSPDRSHFRQSMPLTRFREIPASRRWPSTPGAISTPSPNARAG